ncbi:helix-turn-helix domain-containing protein [Nocardioides fonticola]
MTDHATAASSVAADVAAEVRAGMARRQPPATAGELATVIDVTPHTAGRRLSGAIPFTVVELVLIANWLEIPPAELLNPGARSAAS